jgi:site-specific DNA-cytosine methylase
LGIHPDGLSTGLDGCGGWECGIDRVTTKQPNRVSRIKCLGNAVVPQVVQLLGELMLTRLEAEGE